MNFINIFRDKLVKKGNNTFYSLSNIYFSDLNEDLRMQEELKTALASLIKECRKRKITYGTAMDVIDNLISKFNSEYKAANDKKEYKSILSDFDFSLLFNKEKLNLYIDSKLEMANDSRDLDELKYYFDVLVRDSITRVVADILGDGYDNKLTDVANLTNEELNRYTEFTLVYPYLNSVYVMIKEIDEKISKYRTTIKLREFAENKEFMADLDKIMSHDRTQSTYYYHGAQDVENSYSILEQGLLMMDENLNKTSYPEFTKNGLLLYEWGTLFGIIGKDAVVIIDRPLVNGEELDTVVEAPKNGNFNFSQSGLSGVNGDPKYMVPPEYIVGFVNKRDKKVVFNPKYYKYEELMGENKQL